MKILVLSDTAWNTSNSFGNSYANIFGGMEDITFASIYCREGVPNYSGISCAVMITERQLLSNLKDKSRPAVIPMSVDADGTAEKPREWGAVNVGRKYRWQIMFWARELIWKVGRWECRELKAFLDEFQPDLIFQPLYYTQYINDIAEFVRDYTKAPMVAYISDDLYTLRQFRLSPLYWINRLMIRRSLRRVIGGCEILYVISELQKREYEKIFRKPCRILTKGADFSGPVPVRQQSEGPVKLLYAGNLGVKRWRSLGTVAQAVARLRREGLQAELDIYSPTPLSAAMEKALKKDGCRLHKPVPYAEIQRLQQQADILIHAEGMSLRSRLAVRQSFSTKLVDFFKLGKCIFAIGPKQVASMEHLIKNDAAVTATKKAEVYEALKKLLQEPELLAQYGGRAYECGRKYHDIKTIQSMLQEDLQAIVRKR